MDTGPVSTVSGFLTSRNSSDKKIMQSYQISKEVMYQEASIKKDEDNNRYTACKRI